MVASCSLVLPVYMLTIVISNMFGAGGGTLIARLIGKGEDDEASRVSAACIWMAVIRQIVFNIPILFLFNRLFGVMGIVWTQIVADIFTVIVSYIFLILSF